MRENTNKAIALNSIILYAKMGISTICALFTTRFALQALGINDFGLYSVLGGIISFIGIFNTIMLPTSTRFITVAIGKGDSYEINKQFNVCLIVHIAIAFFTLLVAYPIGHYYILNYINYDGDIMNALMVFAISITASIISFIGVPYNGLMIARENFLMFSAVDVLSHIIRLVVAWLLVAHFEHKLFIYTMTLGMMTAMPTLLYWAYCKRMYAVESKFVIVRDKSAFKAVFNFSAWVSVGAVASIAKSQGAALLVNAFFNTAMNAAMGIAGTINSYVTMFANNMIQPMAPQVTKSFSAGDQKRTNELMVMSTKYAYLMTLLVGSIFMIIPDWLMELWLGEVPPYSVVFLNLFVIDNLVMSLNQGVGNLIFASGKVSIYQIVVSSLNVASVIIGYFVLRCGTPAYYLIYVYICVSIVRFFLVQWTLKHTLNFDNRILVKKSYLPSVVVTFLFIPSIFLPVIIHPLIKLFLCVTYLMILIVYIGLDKKDRLRIFQLLQSKIKK